MPHGICLIKIVFDESKIHLIIILTNQSTSQKWLVKNANLGLVKKYMAQSQWTSSKWLVQDGFFLTKIYSKNT
jgi:hypothetical protein